LFLKEFDNEILNGGEIKSILKLNDGTELECFVIGDFEIEDKSYIALLPKEDERVLLYEYNEDEEGIELINIEDEKEFELVSEAFYELFGDDEDEENEVEDEEEDEE